MDSEEDNIIGDLPPLNGGDQALFGVVFLLLFLYILSFIYVIYRLILKFIMKRPLRSVRTFVFILSFFLFAFRIIVYLSFVSQVVRALPNHFIVLLSLFSDNIYFTLFFLMTAFYAKFVLSDSWNSVYIKRFIIFYCIAAVALVTTSIGAAYGSYIVDIVYVSFFFFFEFITLGIIANLVYKLHIMVKKSADFPENNFNKIMYKYLRIMFVLFTINIPYYIVIFIVRVTLHIYADIDIPLTVLQLLKLLEVVPLNITIITFQLLPKKDKQDHLLETLMSGSERSESSAQIIKKSPDFF